LSFLIIVLKVKVLASENVAIVIIK